MRRLLKLYNEYLSCHSHFIWKPITGFRMFCVYQSVQPIFFFFKSWSRSDVLADEGYRNLLNGILCVSIKIHLLYRHFLFWNVHIKSFYSRDNMVTLYDWNMSGFPCIFRQPCHFLFHSDTVECRWYMRNYKILDINRSSVIYPLFHEHKLHSIRINSIF